MSGLLHISQISFDRIEDLPSILQMGMKLKCMIIDHDKVRHKLSPGSATILYTFCLGVPQQCVAMKQESPQAVV